MNTGLMAVVVVVVVVVGCWLLLLVAGAGVSRQELVKTKTTTWRDMPTVDDL